MLVEHRRGLLPPLVHVVFYGVELGHCPAVRLSWSALDHVAAILWPPQGWMAANHCRKKREREGGKKAKQTYELRDNFSACHIFASRC